MKVINVLCHGGTRILHNREVKSVATSSSPWYCLLQLVALAFLFPLSMPLTAQQENYLKRLFQTGKAPYRPDSGEKISPANIKRVYDQHPVLQVGIKLDNFRNLYRRKAAAFLSDQVASGARRDAGEWFEVIFVAFPCRWDPRSWLALFLPCS